MRLDYYTSAVIPTAFKKHDRQALHTYLMKESNINSLPSEGIERQEGSVQKWDKLRLRGKIGLKLD